MTIKPNLLDEEGYRESFRPPMRDVTTTAEATVDIWPYVGAIPTQDYDGLGLADVGYVYADDQSKFHHVLITTDRDNTFVVVVIDLEAGAITGHHLLDLVRLYGLDQP